MHQNLRTVEKSTGQYRRGDDFDLKSAVGALGISYGDLARELGVPANSVSRWVTGKHPVPGPVVAYVNLRIKVAGVVKALG